VPKQRRDVLEKLCRYGLRGPFANVRLTELRDGRLVYELKRPLPNGSTHLVLDPSELLEKLAALIPPAREHLTLYHGVFAANARLRRKVVPAGRIEPLRRLERRRARGKWSELLKRVFKIDVLVCPRCAGPRRMLEAIFEGAIAERILKARGESTRAPVRAPARDPAHPEPAEGRRRRSGAVPPAAGLPRSAQPPVFGTSLPSRRRPKSSIRLIFDTTFRLNEPHRGFGRA
jgi:hypothetical protein